MKRRGEDVKGERPDHNRERREETKKKKEK